MATLERELIPAGLAEMLGQLTALTQSPDYDQDFLAPTPWAISRMRALLTGAGGSLEAAFPLGTLAADGDGGLRLEWIRPSRELRLVVPASVQGRSYLYHEAGADYGADYAPDAEKLGRGLNWLDSGGKAL